MPFNKVKKWAWESYWIVGGLFSWLIVPPVAAYLTVPNFAAIIGSASSTVLFFLVQVVRAETPRTETRNGTYRISHVSGIKVRLLAVR